MSIFAEAGLGKSRLLAEVAASDDARGVAWCEARSVSTGRHLSFHTIVDICRSLVGIAETDDAEHALGKLNETIRRVLPDEVDEVLPFIGTLLGLQLDPSAQARLERAAGRRDGEAHAPQRDPAPTRAKPSATGRHRPG